MDNIYSYLHEVWEPEQISPIPTPSAGITEEKSYMDDIMSAYTDRAASSENTFNVDGYNGYSQRNFYEIDKLYGNDINVIEKQIPKYKAEIDAPVCVQEVAPKLITNIVEPFSDPVKAMNSQYSELIIFLLSGILLIFMFDKLVHLGSRVAGRK
jgi:hypothetical protein